MAEHSPNLQLADLRVGDRVVVTRNLDHPAHKRPVEDGHGTRYVRDESVAVLIGTMTAAEHHAGTYQDPDQVLVRLKENSLWYDCATREQHQCGAMLIAVAPAEPAHF